jgi:hypothetical protein
MRLMRLSLRLNEKRPQPRGYTLGPSFSCASGATGARSKLALPPRVPTNVSFQSFGRRSRSWVQSNGFLTAEERLDIWPVEGSSTT